MTTKAKAIKEAIDTRDENVKEYKINYDKNEILKELSRFELKGNIIDQGWFEHLVNETGKVQSNAIFILSEIVYWYRPQILFDEFTGNIKGLKAKFQGDMAQISYKQLSKKFGLTERQVKNACKFLEEKDLIVLDFRTITLKNNRRLSNVLFMGLNINELRKISILMNDSLEVIDEIKDNIEEDKEEVAEILEERDKESTPIENKGIANPITKKSNTLLLKKVTPYYQKRLYPITKNGNTNTKSINTENLNTENLDTKNLDTKNIYTINQSIDKPNNQKNTNDKENKDRLTDFDKQLKSNGFKTFEELVNYVGVDKQYFEYPYTEWIDSFKKAIWEMYYFENTKILGKKVSKYDAIFKLQSLNIDMITTTIDKVIEKSKVEKIKHPVSYIKTAMFNEIDEFSARIQARVNYDFSDSEFQEKPKEKNKTRFHNFEQRTDKYSEEELEAIAGRKRERFTSERKIESQEEGQAIGNY